MLHPIRTKLGALSIGVLALALVPVPTIAADVEALNEATDDPVEIALSYVRDNPKQLGVGAADVADMSVASSYESRHSGITHVNLSQRFNGLEIFGAYATVSIGADGRVIFVGDSLVEGLHVAEAEATELDPIEAVEAAATELELDPPKDLEVISQEDGPAEETILTDGGISNVPILARRGWQTTPDGLRLAWQLVIDDVSAPHLWNATVDAETGDLLDVADWTTQHSMSELAGTLARASGSATSSALGTAFSTASSPSPVNDGSSYRVFEHPKESPNDGARTLVTNPADSFASPFGWHDTNGSPGPEITRTQGNNVHAYTDRDANNQPDPGSDPDGGASLTFDFPADLNEHAQTYPDASVTNLFYWNNIVHDVMYQYGFDEASGNFQANNYGRGGAQGDFVRAEAMDGAGENNANFSTPAVDGVGIPRMQMFVWPGAQFGRPNAITVDSGPAAGTYLANYARFTPAPTTAGFTGEIVLVNDGVGNLSDGCQPHSVPAGAIALVDRVTTCNFHTQTLNAQNAGASSLVVVNNSAAAPIVMTGSMNPTVGIPAVMISRDNGNAIKAGLPATGRVHRNTNRPPIRDGDLESGIIIHEYGHGISNRLTGGPTVNCLTGNEQAGEGWSDFFAITMLLNPALDDPEGPRGMGPYALFQDSRQGNGIRPRPYSRNMEIQPFTYDSIKTGGWLNGTSLALPHGLGHGWASVLWDMTWDLIDKHGFNPNIYEPWHTGGNNRALQYVIDGLKMQGCGPGLVVARDAIIAAADTLSGGEDTCTVWAAFARRGLGFSAVQGTTNRDDNQEAFDTHPACRAEFSGGITEGPTLNTVNVNQAKVVPLVFSAGGDQGLDVLASNSPYSRQVHCETLATVDPQSPFITPRPVPVPTRTPANSGLSYDPKEDRYTYPWLIGAEWAGTCREVVLTRDDGVQHRAYFRFLAVPSHPVSGYVRDTDGQPVANASVTITGALLSPATTDATGFYSFADVPKGTYEATASGSGCNDSQTKTLVVSGPTTLDFALPRRTDGFGYTCRSVVAEFQQAETVLPITGDDVARTVDLPFPLTFYGETYTQAHVCTNGFVEFVGPTNALCQFSNAAIPNTARPNGAVYGYWDDLFVDASASIRAEEHGTGADRRFVIEYRNVRYFNDTTRRIDVAIVLYENGQILTQYRNIADDGRERGNSATIGIEHPGSTTALQYSLNTPILGVEPAVTSVMYQPPPTG